MSRIIGNINGIDITEEDDLSVTYTAGAQIDGDGANGQFGGDPCYAPKDYTGPTLDVLANAGHPGNWFGVVTEQLQRNLAQGFFFALPENSPSVCSLPPQT